jgi:hypothetical protein
MSPGCSWTTTSTSTAGQALVEIDPKELDLKVAEADAALKNAVADQATARGVAFAARPRRGDGQGKRRDGARAPAQGGAATSRATRGSSDRRHHGQPAERHPGRLGHGRGRARRGPQRGEDGGRADRRRRTRAWPPPRPRRPRRPPTWTTRSSSARTPRSRPRSPASSPARTSSPASTSSPGQTLLSVASESDVWVVANFKETQLTHMKPGQDVEFEVDSYPGVAFHGKVESISGATGARFALLPPDNSTGNFVKVTQRVPVKIVLAQAPDADHPLRPGMSVDAVVSRRRIAPARGPPWPSTDCAS